MVVPGGTIDDVGKPAVEEVPSPPASLDGAGAGDDRFTRPELGDVVILPESFSYRLKKALLGPPLVTERLSVERLGKPMALGVLAPDCISSTAYGTEEILFELVKAVGVAAFSLLLPITFAVIVVLLFVTLSYREVVMVYTRAGGSYVVARDNFGVKVAQVAAVALIIDYIVTVAVQTAAGTDALTSAFPTLTHWGLEITVVVVAVLAYGNLRGSVRRAGVRLPTYLFAAATGSLIIIGAHPCSARPAAHALDSSQQGRARRHSRQRPFLRRLDHHRAEGLRQRRFIADGPRGDIQRGRDLPPPEGRNARRVLVIMSTILGFLVLGVSLLAHITHAVPYLNGSPTVLSQEAKYVFGSAWFGKFGFFFVQAATMLILYTGANTSFNGFPNLASFVAEDAFLPRRLPAAATGSCSRTGSSSSQSPPRRSSSGPEPR